MNKKKIIELAFNRKGLDSTLYVKVDSELAVMFTSANTVPSRYKDSEGNLLSEFVANNTDNLVQLVYRNTGINVYLNTTETRYLISGDRTLSIAVLSLVGVADGLHIKIDEAILDSEFTAWAGKLAKVAKHLYSYATQKVDIKINIETEIL